MSRPGQLGIQLLAAVILYQPCEVEAAPACVLRSDAVELGAVRVRPPGHEPFVVMAEGVSVVARIGPSQSNPVTVTVKGSLLFRGVPQDLRFAIPNALYNVGPLHLAPHLTLGNPRLGKAGAVLLDAQLAEGVKAIELSASCSDLSLATRASKAKHRSWSAVSPNAVYPAHPRLKVWKRAGSGESINIEVRSPGLLPMEARSQMGGDFVEIESSLPGGFIEGYVRSTSITKSPQHGGLSLSGAGTGYCGCLGPERSWVHIAAGTKVFAGPGTHPWAVVRGEAYGLASRSCKAGYARIFHLPDIASSPGGHLEHVWVSSRSLTLPRGGPWSCQ